MRGQRITISVIGGHDIKGNVANLAHNVGELVARVGAVLVCGGLDGVMKCASRGAREAGGLTIGLLPGKEKTDANQFIDIALPTSMGYSRNAMVACSAHVIIALPGSYGTESEICYGLVYGRPVIDLGGWNIPGMIKVKNIKEAEAKVKALIKKISEQQQSQSRSRKAHARTPRS